MREPAYVEPWDSSEFPTVDVRSSSLDVPLFHQTVFLTRGIAQPGTPDAGAEVWIVVQGHQRVAKSFVECGAGDQDRSSDINRWIAEGSARDRREQKAWRSGREAEIAAHPDIAAALDADDSAETLYDRAGLSDGQRVAMRLFCQTDDEGQFKGYAAIAKELKIGKDSARDRVEGAIDKILAIGSDAG